MTDEEIMIKLLFDREATDRKEDVVELVAQIKSQALLMVLSVMYGSGNSTCMVNRSAMDNIFSMEFLNRLEEDYPHIGIRSTGYSREARERKESLSKMTGALHLIRVKEDTRDL